MEFQKFNQMSAQSQAVGYDQGLRAHMLSVYNYMASGLALTGIVAYLIAQSETATALVFGTPGVMMLLMFAQLGVVIYLSARLHKMSFSTAQSMFWLYAVMTGVTFSVLFLAYKHESIARVFFITSGLFGAMSLWGYSTRKDLTGMGSFMMMGLFGIIIASLVNLFIGSTMIQFAVSAIGVVVFTGLTAYDTQKIRQMYYALEGQDSQTVGKSAIMGALTLYLDFINLFIMLMRIMGDRR